MIGTVNSIVPLSLLEAVRSVDIPEGEDVDVEYVQEHRNKRLGLSDTVIAQIRRYKDAMKRNQPIAIHEASGIARLIGCVLHKSGTFAHNCRVIAVARAATTTLVAARSTAGNRAAPAGAKSMPSWCDDRAR